MKKKIGQLNQRLSMINNTSPTVIGPLMSAAAGIPALSSVAHGLDFILAELISMCVEPLLNELQDLINNNGPQAQHYLRTTRVSERDNQEVDKAKVYIQNQYPVVFQEKMVYTSTILRDLMFPNMFSRKGSPWATKYGENTCNYGPCDPKVAELFENWNNAKQGMIIYSSRDNNSLFPENWKGSVIVTLKPTPKEDKSSSHWYEIVFDYSNGCSVTYRYVFNFKRQNMLGSDEYVDGSYTNVDFPEVTILGSTLMNMPRGQRYLARSPSYSPYEQELPKLFTDCLVYNRWEDVEYPAGPNLICQQVAQDVIKKFFEDNGIVTNQDHLEHWLDDRKRYIDLKQYFAENPTPQDEELPVPELQDSQIDTLMFDAIHGASSIVYEECSDLKLKQKNPETGEVIGFKDAFFFHHRFADGSQYRRNNRFNVIFVFDDVAETCTISIMDRELGIMVNPTPLMIQQITQDMYEARSIWIKQRNKTIEDNVRRRNRNKT